MQPNKVTNPWGGVHPTEWRYSRAKNVRNGLLGSWPAHTKCFGLSCTTPHLVISIRRLQETTRWSATCVTSCWWFSNNSTGGYGARWVQKIQGKAFRMSRYHESFWNNVHHPHLPCVFRQSLSMLLISKKRSLPTCLDDPDGGSRVSSISRASSGDKLGNSTGEKITSVLRWCLSSNEAPFRPMRSVLCERRMWVDGSCMAQLGTGVWNMLHLDC